MKFVHPIDNYKTIVSGYGLRKDPFTGQVKFHKGIDYKIPIGTPVKAAEDGKTIFAGTSGNGYGKHIIISHPDNLYTLYGHLSEILIENNQTVTKGNLIAYSGNSGRSTGSHLHFEIRNNKESLDPSQYLKYTLTPQNPDSKLLIFGSIFLFFLFKK
jgi:murein DD-endopeptidase MepM/ murein hydrolase activator NlpD